ncbi:MAG: hypothetical protein IJO98_08470 [Clostridia bacterium]|nr:hypothetical protein [Clostridia bacterium]
MSNRHETILADFKARQLAGEHMECPRCGSFTMKPALHTNALSRHADIYICDGCGTEEAVLAFMSAPLPLNRWAAFQPKRPASDFIARSSTDVLSEVMRTQVPLLIETFRQLDRGELDSGDAEYEVYSQCAGLTDFGASPFQAQYETADGKVLIRIRKRGDEIEYSASAFTR